MKITNQYFQVLGALLVLAKAPSTAAQEAICPDLRFTEIADPNDLWNARFVELYSSSGDCTIWQHNGKDIYFTTIFNANSGYSSQVLLTGQSISADGFFILCNNVDNFLSAYPTSFCDLASSLVGSNGDDSYLVRK